MELTVKLVSGECRSVHVSPSATVGELKRAVAQSFNEALSRVRLSTNNGVRATLDHDSAPLSSFGLSSGSTVMLLLRALSVLQVFVKNEKGQTKTYDVTEEETVDDLQRKIYNKERTPVDQQRLIFNGRQLEAGSRLRDYDITNGSTIHMTLRLRGG
ncbi:polyubiquitin-like [Salminus brasiliensis]|uniref:polyubiquitin-like n=1 Tax=Salminus brasiliensis TaxID=930266 RepID=UPI003B833893